MPRRDKRDEGQTLIEKAHFDVYGMSISERKALKEKRRKALAEGDDAFFDTPTILRK